MSFKRFAQAVLAPVLTGLGAADAAAWCVSGVERWDTLRIRAAPTPYAREIGAMPPNACGVAVVGACRGGWCPVAWRGQVGWSNSYYLSRGGLLQSLGPPVAALRPMLMPPPPQARTARLVTPSRRAGVTRTAPTSTRASHPPQRRVAVTSAEAPANPPPVQRSESSPVDTLPLAPPPVAAPSAPPPAMAPTPPPAPSPASPAPAVVTVAPAAAAIAAPAPKAGTSAPPTAAGATTQSEVCVVDVAKGETLKVRAGPGSDQSLRFGYPAGVCGVKLTGPCKDGWCPVDYRGYRGWAEQKNLK